MSNDSANRRLPLKINDLLESSSTLSFKEIPPSIQSTELNTSNPNSDTDDKEQNDILLAVSALGQLKSNNHLNTQSKSSNNNNKKNTAATITSHTNVIDTTNQQNKSTILDKVISHPLISNSISYVLEKTINTSNKYVLSPDQRLSPPPHINSQPIPLQPINKLPALPSLQSTIFRTISPPHMPSPLARPTKNSLKRRQSHSSSTDPLISSNLKRSKISKDLNQTIVSAASSLPKQRIRRSIPNSSANLRQQVAISSAISTQRSLQDLKDLSTLNINIESRKKLTMLIHFLKLGNNQLSERIENLIHVVSNKRDRMRWKTFKEPKKSIVESETRSNSESDIPIQQIKTDIVNTVKKIVNVVSKVSASSLSEPARSNVRNALLKLPANWAAMLNNDKSFLVGNEEDDEEQSLITDVEYDDDDDDDDADIDGGGDDDDDDDADKSRETDDDDTASIDTQYEDSLEYHTANTFDVNQYNDSSVTLKKDNSEDIPTITVHNKVMFKRNRKSSISQRQLNSLLRYRKKKDGENEEIKNIQGKQWFKKNIKDQILHDPNGKVLILAQESLDMVNKIIKFCNESLDKAETWNSSRQKQHQVELLQRLKDINYVTPVKKGEDVETIIVKGTANKPSNTDN